MSLKKKAEYFKVQAAALELQIIIEDKEAELIRLKESLKISEAKIEQLKTELEAQGE